MLVPAIPRMCAPRIRYWLAGFAFLTLACVGGAGRVAAQRDGDPVTIGTYRVIESRILGETRRLLIHLPRGYEGGAISYPVVYHTYGDYVSTYFADAYSTLESLPEEGRTPQMILVGIDNIDRYRDLRPLSQEGAPAGIGNYTRFLVEEVIPFVEKNYRAAGYRILAGPQAGAVFGLYTLQTSPDLFDAFILNNPLLSPPNTALLLEQASSFYASRDSLRRFCFIAHGSADESPENAADVQRLVRLAEPARAAGFDLRLHDLSGSDAFIPPLPLREGLRALFADYYVPRDRPFGSLAEIEAFYARLSGRYGFALAPAEAVMTHSADVLLERGERAKAVEILERQTALYPNLVNGWWRLAGVAASGGDKDRAIELYRKCVELNPSMKNFVERRIQSLTREDPR